MAVDDLPDAAGPSIATTTGRGARRLRAVRRLGWVALMHHPGEIAPEARVGHVDAFPVIDGDLAVRQRRQHPECHGDPMITMRLNAAVQRALAADHSQAVRQLVGLDADRPQIGHRPRSGHSPSLATPRRQLSPSHPTRARQRRRAAGAHRSCSIPRRDRPRCRGVPPGARSRRRWLRQRQSALPLRSDVGADGGERVEEPIARGTRQHMRQVEGSVRRERGERGEERRRRGIARNVQAEGSQRTAWNERHRIRLAIDARTQRLEKVLGVVARRPARPEWSRRRRGQRAGWRSSPVR